MKKIFILFLLLFSTQLFSQSFFEKWTLALENASEAIEKSKELATDTILMVDETIDEAYEWTISEEPFHQKVDKLIEDLKEEEENEEQLIQS